jgi:EAL domain-containing protein (putative c-di-GMP-specific phosphodiesterase class I)
MAVQHVDLSARDDFAAPPLSWADETLVLVATALPEAAARALPALVAEAAAHLLGIEHLIDLSVLDDSAVAATLTSEGPEAARVRDPALGPALEAYLSAALRTAGHSTASVAVMSAGPPRSSEARARELFEEKLLFLQARTRGQAEDASFRTEIAQIIEGGGVRTMFQAIVSAADGHVLGYEALSRGPSGHRWERPDHLLEAAHRAGLSSLVQWEMTRLARQRAQERLLPEGLLFVNSPDTSFWPDAPGEVGTDQAYLWPLARLVSEVSERLPIVNLPAIWSARDQGRAAGVRYALDDVGAGYAGLAALALLAPEFVKIDMALIRDCNQDPAKQAVIAALVQYAQQAEARVIAEGVETDEEARAVCDLGVDLIQGFLFSRPTEEPCR